MPLVGKGYYFTGSSGIFAFVPCSCGVDSCSAERLVTCAIRHTSKAQRQGFAQDGD